MVAMEFNTVIPLVIMIIFIKFVSCEEDPWQIRMQEATQSARMAYNPNPENVVSQLTTQVHRATMGVTNPNDDLQNHGDQCIATNPIDKCWRCQPDWAENRQRLASCSLGFGHQATGGMGGRIYVVTDSSDDRIANPKNGTLRHAVIQPEPLWIIFEKNMSIRLTQELIMTSNKTIDGRGAHVHIANGGGLTLQYVSNVIIHGVHIHDIKKGTGGLIRDAVDHVGHRGPSDGDGISIFSSSNIWIDHVSMSYCNDGLIDAVEGSTAITISNCKFSNHNEVMLFGADDSYSQDSYLQITLAFNHFGKGLTQRMPRVRRGFVHVINNDYNEWLKYAIGGSKNPTILSHGNRFRASTRRFTKEVTVRHNATQSVWQNWLWKSEGDIFENGAYFTQSGDLKKFSFNPIDGSFVRHLTRFSGALKCSPNKPC